jgi:hypothetical protein
MPVPLAIAARTNQKAQRGTTALHVRPWPSQRVTAPGSSARGFTAVPQRLRQPQLPPSPRLPGIASSGASAGFSLAFGVALIVLLSSLARRSASIRRLGSTAGRPRHFVLLLERPG